VCLNPADDEPDCVILLDAQKGRWDFPELKEIAMREYRYWDTDMVLIEAKASGTPSPKSLDEWVFLLLTTRRLEAMTKTLGCTPLLLSLNQVWCMLLKRAFAEDMIEECASFPFGAHDDLCDTMTQALMRFREGGFVNLNSDYEDEEREPRERVYY
jgi:phage terminase large subunit-like protein